MDREGQDPFDLLDELEAKLNIRVRPLSWPINQGARFKGVYNLFDKSLNLFSANKTRISEDVIAIENLADPQLDELLEEDARRLRADVDLIEGVYDTFNENAYLAGQIAPGIFR